MMHRFQWIAGAIAVLAFAGPLAAQDPTQNPPAVEPPSAQEPAMEQPPVTEPAADQAETQPAHDWEFALAPTEKAPGASATVMVVDEEQGGSGFTIVATGLPAVDELDAENQDVNAYTVWIVPGKDKVNESELAGVLTISPEGTGRLEAETDLETFGVIVTATPDGAPTQISGVPVLTGIPVQANAPPEVAEEAAEAAGEVAEEAAEVDAAAPADQAEEAAEVNEEVQEGMDEVAEEEAEQAGEQPAAEPTDQPAAEPTDQPAGEPAPESPGTP